MFLISMPRDFQVGQTQAARVNGQPASVTWRDEHTLVIGKDDPRVILSAELIGPLIHFTCGGQGKTLDDYGFDGPVVCEKQGEE
jgi:hypothetical protein